MPFIETPADLAEQWADEAGIYNSSINHDNGIECQCRCCFVANITERIRNAVENESRLHNATV